MFPNEQLSLTHASLFCFLTLTLPLPPLQGARKRLVKSLCDIPRACLQLIPFYARIVATLAQVFPDVPQVERWEGGGLVGGRIPCRPPDLISFIHLWRLTLYTLYTYCPLACPQGVISYLEAEFQYLLAKKDMTNMTLEPRIRNAR